MKATLQRWNWRLITAVLFATFVLTYLTIRAFYTEFLSDETATYWYFIIRGAFWGDNVVWDAANHPLNSFLGYHLYNRFGDVPGILRVGSLISYVFYAVATYQFTGLFQRKSVQIIGFLTLNGIPYMLEYFAYSRGYGLSMGFFMLGLWMLIRYAQSLKLVHVILAYVLVFIALAANLTLMNSMILVVLGVAIIHLTSWKKITYLQHGLVVLGTLFLARICWPLVAFAMQLKKSGALYYSNLDGIWDQTGKSLSRYILFTDHDGLMFVLLLLLVVFVVQLWFLLKNGWKSFLQVQQTWVAYLFFGNFVAVLVMAFVMKVHYPEDRTGMYFIPLFFLLVFFIVDRIRYSEYAFLFFPISLLTHLSIHSSVFTPEERMTTAFYNKVKSQLSEDDVVTLYKTMFANWQYHESHQSNGVHFPHVSMRNGDEADVFVTRRGVQALAELRNKYLGRYRLIAEDPMNDQVAYRRIHPRKEKLFFELDSAMVQGSGDFIELVNLPNCFHGVEDVRLKFNFFASIPELRQSTDFVVITTDKNGQFVRSQTMVFELNHQSKPVNGNYAFSVMLDNLQPNEVGMKAYFWNRHPGVKHVAKSIQMKMYSSKSF